MIEENGPFYIVHLPGRSSPILVDKVFGRDLAEHWIVDEIRNTSLRVVARDLPICANAAPGGRTVPAHRLQQLVAFQSQATELLALN